jgi:hypothetical protein
MYKKILHMGLLGIALFSFSACKKFLEVGAPTTSINSQNVYDNDGTAISAVTNIYAQMSNRGVTDFHGVAVYTGLSGDELRTFVGDNVAARISAYKNALEPLTGRYDFWTQLYPYTYYANAAIEGLSGATALTPAVRQQLTGEAYFMRAFAYFYLTSIYGDVPLVLTTDPTVSSTMPKTAKTSVYNQMVSDLQQAKALLSDNYLDGTILKTSTERLRPTKAAASALLARVYLYRGEYANAEAEATSVIGNTNFSFVALGSTFLKNSRETIWALQPVGATSSTGINTPEGRFFNPTTTFNTANPVYFNDNFIASFEPGDNRRTAWVANQGTMYYPFKYKAYLAGTTATEYSIVLRLAEQYLIRAEARAQLNKLTGASGALSDLNAIRNRSGLGDSPATSQADVISAISKERKVELFTEWGDRWFNMQRTNTIDAIMPAVTTTKGGSWNSYQKLYPIPVQQIQRNPYLIQNAGYN